jgi:hypothetical protein
MIEKELQENWQYLKGEILKRWGRLAETDVENAHGNLQALNKLVSSEYGSKNSFMDEIQQIYDELKSNESLKTTRPTNAGQRDNSGERRLNENFSRIISPEEVKSNKTNTPTIFEDDQTKH